MMQFKDKLTQIISHQQNLKYVTHLAINPYFIFSLQFKFLPYYQGLVDVCQIKWLNARKIDIILLAMDTGLMELGKESSMEEMEFNTNDVLKEDKSNRTLYYLPCYIRFKVKEISSLDIEGLQAVISGTLLFSFYYGNLDRHIVDQFVGEGSKAILLQFSRQESLQLREDKGIVYKEDQKTRMIDFVVRQDFNCTLVGDVFYTPFEILNLYLTITVQSVVLDPKQNDGRRIDIKFNSMRSDQVMLISHGQNCAFGNYTLAKYFFDSKYKNSDKNPFPPISVLHRDRTDDNKPKKAKKKENLDDTRQVIPFDRSKNELELDSPTKASKGDSDKKVKHYQYVHFRIPLYKYPGVNLVSIFVPLWVLGFINLLIFFQDRSLSGRIAAIATLTLAFIAFIPTINEQIPQTPNIKLVEILIYVETIASVLCLIQSLLYKDQTADYVWRQDGFFIVALTMNLITVFIVFLLFIIHKCFWEKIYASESDHSKKQRILIRKHWENKECDQQFYDWIKSGKIVVV